MFEAAALKALVPNAGHVVWLIFGMALVAFIRGLPQLFKIKVDADGSMNGLFAARVESLEGQLTVMTENLRLSEARCTAELQIIRHRLNNAEHLADRMIDLYEANPERFAELLPMLKAGRIEAARTIALEQGAYIGARAAGKETT